MVSKIDFFFYTLFARGPGGQRSQGSMSSKGSSQRQVGCIIIIILLDPTFICRRFHRHVSICPLFALFLGLPTTKLGTYLENRINSFLKKKDAGAGEVTIRVLSSSDKMVEVKSGMKTK